MDPCISVIVPIYNVAEYLPRCLDSIIDSSYRELEIILVDDGSTDDCGKIADSYAEKDARIRVIHKNNGGLSSARNAGLDAATSEYIAFIDSDDWIHRDYFRILMDNLIETGSDVSVCGFVRAQSADALTELTEDVTYSVGGWELYFSSAAKNYVWRKLYHRELIGTLRFDTACKIEDLMFNMELIQHNPELRAVYTPQKLYAYFQREGSLVSRIRKEDHIYLIKRFNEILIHESNIPMREFFASASVKRGLAAIMLAYVEGDDESVREYKRISRKGIPYLRGFKNKAMYSVLIACPWLYKLLRTLQDPTMRALKRRKI